MSSEQPNLPKVISIGSDHAGYKLKTYVIEYLNQKYPEIEIKDFGIGPDTKCDYPDIAKSVAQSVVSAKSEQHKGILICWSGIGISIAANKVNGIRAALCHDLWTAEMCRRHNDANILTMGQNVVPFDIATQMVDKFLTTSFDQGEHTARLEKLHNIEE